MKNTETDNLANIIHEKINSLPADSYIRIQLPKDRLAQLFGKASADIEWDYWQPFLMFLKDSDIATIQSLDSDIKTVINATKSNRRNELLFFLKDPQEEDNSWQARLFEIFVKATLLNEIDDSECILDFDLPNKRNIDLKLTLNGREYGIECTTLGDSNADKKRWKNTCEILIAQPDETPYTRSDAYTSGRRLYAAVYNKLAKNFDTSKSQLCSDIPNLLLISIGNWGQNKFSFNWALDELFGNQPTGNKSDISLQIWLENKAALSQKNASTHDLLRALRQLGGILLFSGCQLKSSRINYNASDKFKLSHSEIAAIEKLLSCTPKYHR